MGFFPDLSKPMREWGASEWTLYYKMYKEATKDWDAPEPDPFEDDMFDDDLFDDDSFDDGWGATEPHADAYGDPAPTNHVAKEPDGTEFDAFYTWLESAKRAQNAKSVLSRPEKFVVYGITVAVLLLGISIYVVGRDLNTMSYGAQTTTVASEWDYDDDEDYDDYDDDDVSYTIYFDAEYSPGRYSYTTRRYSPGNYTTKDYMRYYTNRSTTRAATTRDDPYDTASYLDADDFAAENWEEFDDYDEAYDYYEDYMDGYD